MKRENQESGENSSFLNAVLVTVFATIISNFVWEHLKPARSKDDKEVIVVDVRNKDLQLTSKPVASIEKPSFKEGLKDTEPIDFKDDKADLSQSKVQSEIRPNKPFIEEPVPVEDQQPEKKNIDP